MSNIKWRKIYLSAAIRGIVTTSPELLWNVCQWMIGLGVDVLSEHVAGRTNAEKDEIFLQRSGVDRTIVPDDPDLMAMLKEDFRGDLGLTDEVLYASAVAREVDFGWVDASSGVIAFVDGPSTGVGMELQRALDRIDKPPVLCLVHKDNLTAETYMLLGIYHRMYPQFQLRVYTDEESAKGIILKFLVA